MNRRAFLAAIAGAAVAPHVRKPLPPFVLATEEWLDEVYPAWREHFSQLVYPPHSWGFVAALRAVRMPRRDFGRLAEAYSERQWADFHAHGYIGV
jgi:hypothetical protein